MSGVSPSKNGLYVQYGCGFSAPDGWLNFDASPTVRIGKIPLFGPAVLSLFHPVRFPDAVRYGDIVRGLPVPDKQCDGLYCSHVLEHLSLTDFRTAIRQSYRLLKPGGIFRLVMPDLEALVQIYLQDRAQGLTEAGERFVRNSLLGAVSRPKGLISRLRANMGNEHHLWLWDHEGAISELRQAGFTKIRRCRYNDCEDPMFQRVESEDRFAYAVALECRA